jgi:hypothetical protein
VETTDSSRPLGAYGLNDRRAAWSAAAAEHEPMRYWRRDSYLWTLQTMHIEYDPAVNQTTRLLRYDKWQDGFPRMTEMQMFRLQHWNLHEFEDLLAEAGFAHILVTTDYMDARTPRADRDVWTFQATAPNGHTRAVRNGS